MTIQLLAYIPTILGIVFLTIFVFLKNPGNTRNRIFALLTTSATLWLLGLFVADISSANPDLGLVAVRTAIFFANLIPLFFVFFTLTFPASTSKHAKPTSIVALSILPLLLMVLSFSSLMISGVEYKDFGAQPVGVGPLYYVQLAYFIAYFLAGFGILLGKTKNSTANEKVQARLIIIGAFFAVLMNIFASFIFVILGLSQYTVLLGGPAVLLFVAAMSYAIIKHRLFDIRLVVARSVAYVLLLGSLGAIYGAIIFGISNRLFPADTISVAQQVFNVFVAVFLAVTFQPLRRFFEKVTDRVFYRDRYNTQSVLNQLGSVLSSQIDIETISEASLRLLSDTLKIEHARLTVFDEKKVYREFSYGSKRRPLASSAYELLHGNMFITDELEGGAVKRLLAEHELSASVRLKTQEGLVGYLLLGPKSNGSIYVEQDIRLLEIVGSELAIAVQNARSFEKIADFNVTLQKRIKEATKRLAQQNQRLKELDEAKDEFISMASHQLRTPLTAIKGYLSMMGEGDAGKLTDKQYEFTDLAYTSAERMVYLISDMLNVSRINTGKLVIDRAPVNLPKVVASEIKQLERTAKARGVELQFTPPRSFPEANLDEGKMRQVIMNFLDNAIYYAPNSKVEISLEHKGEVIRFTVRDHGIGVPKAEQANLFSKFYRAGNAKKARPDGTGLGLYMAKIVVELQGGSILFHSEEGKGSTFGFEFPLPAVKAKTKTPTKQLAATRG